MSTFLLAILGGAVSMFPTGNPSTPTGNPSTPTGNPSIHSVSLVSRKVFLRTAIGTTAVFAIVPTAYGLWQLRNPDTRFALMLTGNSQTYLIAMGMSVIGAIALGGAVVTGRMLGAAAYSRMLHGVNFAKHWKTYF